MVGKQPPRFDGLARLLAKLRALFSEDRSNELIPPPGTNGDPGAETRDALGDYLRNHARGHGSLGEPIPDTLLRNGAIGAGLLAVAGLVFAILPAPESMRDSGFIIVGDNLIADLTAAGKTLALVLVGFGVLLLVADAALAAYKPRLPLGAHYACAGQIGVGACAVAPSALVVALLVVSLLIWLALVCLALALLGLLAGDG